MHAPTPTESPALLRLAIAAELEAAKTEASASARLKEATLHFIDASEGESAAVAMEAGERVIDARQTHFTASRAHLAAIDRVKNAEAWAECHAKEAACPWTGATPAAPTT